MTRRLRWSSVWLCAVCLGCQVTPLVAPASNSETAQARQLWALGQAALRQGNADEAIVRYQQGLAADPTFARIHLSLAAAYLEKGDEAQACPHLAAYLQAHPEQLLVRVNYAELLLRQRRPHEARDQFERFQADAQEQGPLAADHLIHCHTRLLEIAEAQDDGYAEHLNRGIGLYLLAGKRATLPEPEGELSTEGLLCQAAAELTLARRQRPDEARPCWYLHAVWSRLAQHGPAQRWLKQADALAPLSYLTPAEHRSLQLACRCAQEGRRP